MLEPDETSARPGEAAESWPSAADVLGGAADPAATLAALDWVSRQRAAMYAATDVTAPRQARALARSIALTWPACERVVEDVELIVSELVANAVTHARPRAGAGGVVAVSISFCPQEGAGVVIVRVRDGSPLPPRLPLLTGADALAHGSGGAPLTGDELDALLLGLSERGRGLRLVAERAAVGWYRVGARQKVVWAQIPTPRPELALALAGTSGPGDLAAFR